VTHDILVAVLVLGFPALALGLLIAPLCGERYAGYALGPVAALAAIMLGCRAASMAGLLGGEARTWAVLAVGAVAALLCVLRRRPTRWLVAPLLAAAVVFALLIAPVVDRGAPTVLGYNISNDSAFHATTAAWIAEGQPVYPLGSHGRAVADLAASSGYPLGSHELVALATAFADEGVVAAYQPALAVILAFGAFVAWWALRRVGVRPGLAALGGVLAAAGYMQYEFYAQGFLPQMAATPFVFGAIGLAVEGATTRRVAPFLLALITGFAAVQAYSLGIAAYLGPVIAACIVVAVVRSERPWRSAALLAGAGLLGALVLVVAFRPLVDQAIDFLESARAGGLQGENVAGHLVGPADRRLIWGSWLGTDFRYPYLRYRITEGGIMLAVALATIGIAWSLVRRRLAVAALVASALIGYLVIRRDSGIYYVAKSYQMLAFPLACAVVAGAASFVSSDRLRLRVVGAIVAGALLAGYGIAAWRSLEWARDGTTYSNGEIRQLPDLAPAMGDGLALGLVIDDLAKAQLPTMDNRGDQQYAPLAPGASVGRAPTTLRVLDLDQFPASILDTHDEIVERRIGGLSMPGPPYRLAATTDDYRLWRRPPGPITSARRPVELPGAIGGVTVEPGGNLGLADADWRRVAIGVRPLDGFLLPLKDYETVGTIWRYWDGGSGQFASIGNGSTNGLVIPVEITSPGRYRVAVLGAAARPFHVIVDGGEPLRPPVPASVEGRDGAQYLGSVELDAGTHRVEVAQGLMTVATDLSYVTAVSLEREPYADRSAVCVRGQRHEVAWDRPLVVDTEDGSVPLENCGDVPLFVDWVEPLPAPP
jgi:hypothetical protein